MEEKIILSEIKQSQEVPENIKMANVLSHEIRNYLANITNAAYLLKLEVPKMLSVNPNSKAQRHIEILERGVKSIDRIIQDMLDFSTNRQPAFCKENIANVVKEGVSEVVIPEGIKVNYELSDALTLFVCADEIKRAIHNIVRNSIDSLNERNDGQLNIKVVQDPSDLNAILIDISDNGCGIKESDVAEVFKPYFSTKAKGVGLGLAVVNRIIKERHGGVVSVESASGKGTKITMKLFKDKNCGAKK